MICTRRFSHRVRCARFRSLLDPVVETCDLTSTPSKEITMARRRKGSLASRRAGKKCRFGFRKGSARCLKRSRRRRR